MLQYFLNRINQLFCPHAETEFVRNVYGDDIIRQDCRSLHKCVGCGAVVKSDELVDE